MLSYMFLACAPLFWDKIICLFQVENPVKSKWDMGLHESRVVGALSSGYLL